METGKNNSEDFMEVFILISEYAKNLNNAKYAILNDKMFSKRIHKRILKTKLCTYDLNNTLICGHKTAFFQLFLRSSVS